MQQLWLSHDERNAGLPNLSLGHAARANGTAWAAGLYLAGGGSGEPVRVDRGLHDLETALSGDVAMMCPRCGSPPKWDPLRHPDDIVTCYLHGHTLEPPVPLPVVPVEKVRRKPLPTLEAQQRAATKKALGKEIRAQRMKLGLRAWSVAFEMELTEGIVYAMESGSGYEEVMRKTLTGLRRLENKPERVEFLRKLKKEKLW